MKLQNIPRSRRFLKYRLKINKKKQPSVHYDVDSLQNIKLRDSFQRKLKIQLQEKVADLSPDCDVELYAEKLYSALKIPIEDTIPKRRKPNNVWISHEVSQLAAEKRLAKQSRFESPANMKLYRDLCNQVRSAAKTDTAQKMKFSVKNFFSKCDQIRSFLRIWSHLLNKSLTH